MIKIKFTKRCFNAPLKQQKLLCQKSSNSSEESLTHKYALTKSALYSIFLLVLA